MCMLPPARDNMYPNSSENLTASDSPSSLRAKDELMLTSAFGTVLSFMCVAGLAGNVYTLVLMCQSMRSAASMYIYIVSLALADLLYLSTIPFIVCTSLAKSWYFGDLGCRLLLSLDLLTMHASIFTLTVMCTERYLAVVKPLAMVKRSQGYRKAMAGAVWLLSLFLTLPVTSMVNLQESRRENGTVRRMCAPTWTGQTYTIYLTVLFNTSIVAPGVIIGFLYTQLARTYLQSQRNTLSKRGNSRSSKQRVVLMIFGIVVVFWACFLPFWVWQLIRLYCKSLKLTRRTVTCINYLMTCLTYSNSCINPFLYTLLTKNYKEYMKNKQRHFQRSASASFKRHASLRPSLKSISSCNQTSNSSESIAMGHLKGSK
ncbi:urotensin-2 receptor [Chiloscyllium punctatum]|uniref:urotensin-2 receptor n=1 Tax=Chiloscyllium plagiosum TaxID=36176 RepID=UPI001CB86BD0|nr:urotensin-2 receptor [Chiloscyllium plagiosum]XP_043570179.1 urotensin-2 receptor [Chiloscyllium plagiosum]